MIQIRITAIQHEDFVEDDRFGKMTHYVGGYVHVDGEIVWSLKGEEHDSSFGFERCPYCGVKLPKVLGELDGVALVEP